MTNNKAVMEAKKRYYAKNRDKINNKNIIYSREHYAKNKAVISDRNLNNYHYKQFLKIMLEEDVPCN